MNKSIFIFQSTIDLAVGAVKRLKTVRHPSVLTYLDSKYVGLFYHFNSIFIGLKTAKFNSSREVNDKSVSLATEPITPLLLHLGQLDLASGQTGDYLAWGIFQVTPILIYIGLSKWMINCVDDVTGVQSCRLHARRRADSWEFARWQRLCHTG